MRGNEGSFTVFVEQPPYLQGSGIGHVANNYLRPILLLPKKTGFR